ncbi:MAG: MAPEG family protein [Halioglobus sp.]|nr:MAPEG family protein [Halioglobus sp.]
MIIYYCLTIVLVLPIILALGSIPFRIKQLSRMDLNNPRGQATLLTGAGSRIIDAQKNAWEALIFFTVVLFIAVSNNVQPEQISTACLVFVGMRLLHAVFYLADLAPLRFLAFAGGFIAAMSIVRTAIF